MEQRLNRHAERRTRPTLPREIVIRSEGRLRCIPLGRAVCVGLAGAAVAVGLWAALGLGLQAAGGRWQSDGSDGPPPAEAQSYASLTAALAASLGALAPARADADVPGLIDALAAERGAAAYGHWMLKDALRGAEAELAFARAEGERLAAAVSEARLRLQAAERQAVALGDSGAELGGRLRAVRAELQGLAVQRAVLAQTQASLQQDRAAAARLASLRQGQHGLLRQRLAGLEEAVLEARSAEVALLGRLAVADRALARAVGPWQVQRARRRGLALIDYLFPLRQVPPGAGPEAALVLAVMRQESGFGHDAVSSDGASGLMQLMPATAAHLARKLQLDYDEVRLVEDPELNVQLGRAYLDQLLRRFRGSYVLAIAAYNAGPGRVEEWVRRHGDPRRPEVQADRWIASIPFRETRVYVRNVLLNLAVYRERLPQQTAAMAQAAGPARTLQAAR